MHARTNHLMGSPRQDRQGWLQWHITWSVTIGAALGLALISARPVQAETFDCRAGDVQCLIAAMNEANASGKKNEIRLEAGIYTLVDVENTTDGPNGLPSIAGPLTIRGAGIDLTVIERHVSASAFRLLHVAPTGVLTLASLTGRGGVTEWGGFGGGLLNLGGTLTLSEVLFTENGRGGLNGSTGGGLYSAGPLMVTKSVFIGNRSEGGGGLLSDGSTTISKSSFFDNVSYGFGAGLLLRAGSATITDTVIADNFTTHDGGGLVYSGRALVISNTTITRNWANGGIGGLQGTGFGSGILGGNISLLNATITDNVGAGGISTFPAPGEEGPVVLENTILARNTFGGGPLGPPLPRDSDCFGLVISQGHNLIGDPTGCPIPRQSTDLTGDPGLGPYTDDGTPGNGHFPLLATSEAINGGNDATCPKTDQLGEHRDKPCDIGAIEFQGKVMSSR